MTHKIRAVTTLTLLQILLRFNLQPCSLAKPFDEMVVGFYVHENMNFVVSERKEKNALDDGLLDHANSMDAGAIAGAQEE